jgi:hypothetical protein
MVVRFPDFMVGCVMVFLLALAFAIALIVFCAPSEGGLFAVVLGLGIEATPSSLLWSSCAIVVIGLTRFIVSGSI